MSRSEPAKDRATVTPAGERLGQRIEGVIIRHAITQTDERGTLCEILDSSWGVHPLPVVSVRLDR